MDGIDWDRLPAITRLGMRTASALGQWACKEFKGGEDRFSSELLASCIGTGYVLL